VEWLVIEDFNLIRRPKGRNKEGGDTNEMFLFNEVINTLGLTELPLHGRRFTWTNKQPSPLLEGLIGSLLQMLRLPTIQAPL
jgi:hypothetical protein